jgi:hypothetical protein
MQEFLDSKNRRWRLELTLGAAMRVKAALGVDLLAPEAGDPPLLQRLALDESLLAETIVSVLGDQLGQVSPEEVYGAFDGKALLAAHDAFYQELADFFRQRGRLDRATAVEKQLRLIQTAVAAAVARIEAIQIPGA